MLVWISLLVILKMIVWGIYIFIAIMFTVLLIVVILYVRKVLAEPVDDSIELEIWGGSDQETTEISSDYAMVREGLP